MAAYDDVFGSMLIGAWLAAMLYGVVVTQSYQYFLLHPEDGMYRKFLVLSTVLFCTVALAADYANVYLPTVTFWGDTEKVQKQYWPVPLFVTTSTFVGVLVNSFLIHRFYSMSKNLWISILLCLLLVTSFAGSVMVAITIQEFKLYTSRDKAKTAALIWTIATAATDIGIAGALVWQLLSIKSSFKGTQSFIKRVIIQTAQTGSTTSIVSIITLVTYLIKNDSNVPTACNFLIAPLYALTLLSNLKLRRRGHPAAETNSIRMSGIIRFHHTTLATDDIDADPTRTEHPQYPDASIKNDTEPYGGNKVPDF
ncbi:hypothetical protein DFH08DRAFT_941366 [Mycena albidolilacea]|uniref:DUF6534 domain-containing protein n=1 Tax=Mycena albidolilacea TaxID=1033008 RepID=A0AAD6ZIE6_9AGAR|nr:hypothetical protein DFH08DRAFT_941366 [Mycena albidolilacea]